MKTMHWGPFHVRGYTLVTPPGKRGEAKIPTFKGDYSIGLHVEAYPPGCSFGSGADTAIECWITVEKA